jgi:hypothetical protein
MTCHRKPSNQEWSIEFGPFCGVGETLQKNPLNQYKFRSIGHPVHNEAMPKMDWSIANLESVKEFLMEQKSQGKFKPTFRCGL